ncbi:hypothetical protein [Methylobacterium crusticola]|uniref:hypothetical protein n=1 Tax=Methylobacterium crusticola TaxID=1697972 RepID=UPI000FFBF156|nr:hypothetical protein [Methylobacterium crusticola]
MSDETHPAPGGRLPDRTGVRPRHPGESPPARRPERPPAQGYDPHFPPAQPRSAEGCRPVRRDRDEVWSGY